MEKSIEQIWKDGFLKQEALIAPKVNDLYNRKSIHLVEKFQRMFKINIWGIIIGASLILIASFGAGAGLAGVIIFITLMAVAYSAKLDSDGLKQLDKGQSSFEYLSSFREWIQQSIEKYGSLYRIVYPVFILTFYFGLWFSDLLEPIREKVAENSSNLIFGMHVPTTLLIIGGAIAMGFFAKRIHREDVELMYGKIMGKLDEALQEMEELRTTK
ncbi:hypothetical protein [Algoriphagus formosus]|uniref:Uncharacterized protein n=1 Tax=Algoriphagus formosus TaxID=2007308 RepID=A0A4R5VDE5_9BACT|nr:hypothetical protein [Algoriphagus aquimaris]TDK50241.1 hypothetical protein E1898_01390 [Algoriphagus aquimaris]